MLNRHDPLEQHIRRRKRFEECNPSIRGLKIFRDGGKFYLLHLADEPIDRLRYRQRRRRAHPGAAVKSQIKVEKRCVECATYPAGRTSSLRRGPIPASNRSGMTSCSSSGRTKPHFAGRAASPSTI